MSAENQVTGKRHSLAALALLGIVLVAFTSFVQAVHVHNGSKLASHECSLCSVAHSGVAVSVPYCPAPVFASTPLEVLAEANTHSSGFVPSLRIRPPPEA